MAKSRKYSGRGRKTLRKKSKSRSRSLKGAGPSRRPLRSATAQSTAASTTRRSLRSTAPQSTVVEKSSPGPLGYVITYKSKHRREPKRSIDFGPFLTEEEAAQAALQWLNEHSQVLILDLLNDRGKVDDPEAEAERIINGVRTYKDLIDVIEDFQDSFYKDPEGWNIKMTRVRM
jgi:hypothetical protein